MLQISGLVGNGPSDYLQYVLVVGVSSNFPVGPGKVRIPGKRASFQFNPEPFNMGDYADYCLIMTNNGYPVDSAPPEFEIGAVEAGPGILRGGVTFPGPGQAELPILWAATFADQGKLIEVASSYLKPDALGAGGTSTFEIELGQQDYSTYELCSEYFLGE